MRACRCRLVLLQGSDLFLVLFVAFIEGDQLGVHLTEELLALGLELVATEALELELVFQLIGQDLEFGFGLLDTLLQHGDCFFLCLQSLEFLLRRFAACCP